MSNVQIEEIDKGRYLISERKFGQRICIISFAYEAREQLGELILKQLAGHIKDTIVERLNLEP